MKTYEAKQTEAESVLEHVADLIKRSCENAVGADDISATSSLVDSYSRLYVETK